MIWIVAVLLQSYFFAGKNLPYCGVSLFGSSVPGRKPLIRLMALRFSSSSTWEYFSVVTMEAWPIRFWMIRIGTFCSISLVAKVCRSAMDIDPLQFTALANCLYPFLVGSGVGVGSPFRRKDEVLGIWLSIVKLYLPLEHEQLPDILIDRRFPVAGFALGGLLEDQLRFLAKRVVKQLYPFQALKLKTARRLKETVHKTPSPCGKYPPPLYPPQSPKGTAIRRCPSLCPRLGQDFCKRQTNYIALCLQAPPAAPHHVKPRSGG